LQFESPQNQTDTMKALLSAAFVALASAASLVPVRNFGPNPSGITMNIYVPDKLPPKPAIVVVVRPPLRAPLRRN
jgi:acetylxylan esterase